MTFEEEFPSLYKEDKENFSGSIGKEFENRNIMETLSKYCLDKQRVRDVLMSIGGTEWLAEARLDALKELELEE